MLFATQIYQLFGHTLALKMWQPFYIDFTQIVFPESLPFQYSPGLKNNLGGTLVGRSLSKDISKILKRRGANNSELYKTG